jgi:transposase
MDLPKESMPVAYVAKAYHAEGVYLCWVVAPALLPKKAGDRVTTNRREAIQLAGLMRAGKLPPVYVPQGADEASRDLRRARAEALRDLKTAKYHRKAFLPAGLPVHRRSDRRGGTEGPHTL